MTTVLVQIGADAAERIEAAVPGVTARSIAMSGPVEPDVRGEVLLTFTPLAENLDDVLSRGVRWVHHFATGVDRVPFDRLGDRTLTCSRGASAIPIAEFVMAAILAAEKDMPDVWITEPTEQWNVSRLGELCGKTVGLVGLGGIGTEVARRALAFGCRVVAARRSARPSGIDGVDVASLDDVLAAADHLVLAAPATPATRHLIDADSLARAKPGVHLVNVGRGALVDQEALVDALDRGVVARASLDVCDPEPLPAGHPLYAHPQVRLSPHVSWGSPHAMDRLLDAFVADLRRWEAGEPLLGAVDVAAGY